MRSSEVELPQAPSVPLQEFQAPSHHNPILREAQVVRSSPGISQPPGRPGNAAPETKEQSTELRVRGCSTSPAPGSKPGGGKRDSAPPENAPIASKGSPCPLSAFSPHTHSPAPCGSSEARRSQRPSGAGPQPFCHQARLDGSLPARRARRG